MVLTKRICPITEVFLILQISPLILMTLMLDLGVKLSGEIICVSLSGVKELKNRPQLQWVCRHDKPHGRLGGQVKIFVNHQLEASDLQTF